MSVLVQPHGGDGLKPLMVAETERAADLARAEHFKKVPMSSRETADVLMFAMGAYTPLAGFMGEADWRGVCADMKMADGLFWPIPITIAADKDQGDSIGAEEEVALVDEETGKIMAIMQVGEKYRIDREFECQHVYRTTDAAHPGAQKVLEQRAVNLAGRVHVIDEAGYPEQYGALYVRPADSRALFADKGWSRVAAFQTRNPMHRSHEYLAKIAVEVCDGVFIHQVLGKLKAGDIPANVRTDAIQTLIDHYFVDGTVVQAGYPIEMRYAGPREALIHALIRQNFGCSHLIVGRDHAGVGDYYGPFDAQHIFEEIPAGSLETAPLKIDITFFCRKCYGMATNKTCPHGEEHRINVSGTRLREMFTNHEQVPPEFSRPEVVEVLTKYYDSIQ